MTTTDAMKWAATIARDRFDSEFFRVFGSINVDCQDGAVCADGWPERFMYDRSKASAVLSQFADGHGTTERGDAEVCRAIELAGAIETDDEDVQLSGK